MNDLSVLLFPFIKLFQHTTWK